MLTQNFSNTIDRVSMPFLVGYHPLEKCVNMAPTFQKTLVVSMNCSAGWVPCLRECNGWFRPQDEHAHAKFTQHHCSRKHAFSRW